MATTKQRKLAKVIIENAVADAPLNKKAMLEKVGYSTSVAEAKATDIIESDGVQEALEEYGFTEDNAKKVVAEILLKDTAKDNDRLKAADMVFEVHGSKAPTKSINVNLDLDNGARQKAKGIIEGFIGTP